MTSPELDPIDALIRKTGAELDEAYRASGTPLPPGFSGEQLARWAIEGMQRDNQRWAPEFSKLEQQVRAELPPGASKEDYVASLWAKVEDWLRNHPDFFK